MPLRAPLYLQRPPTTSHPFHHHPHCNQVISQSLHPLHATLCLPCLLLLDRGSVRKLPPSVPLSIMQPNWPGLPPPAGWSPASPPSGSGERSLPRGPASPAPPWARPHGCFQPRSTQCPHSRQPHSGQYCLFPARAVHTAQFRPHLQLELSTQLRVPAPFRQACPH